MERKRKVKSLLGDLGPFYICVLSAAFYLHSYRLLNDSMLIVRDDAKKKKKKKTLI